MIASDGYQVTGRKELAPGVFQLVTNQGRMYELPGHDRPVPSVTNVLGIIGKPALVAWSARVEREAVVHAAVQLHADHVRGNGPLMNEAVYRETLLARLGSDKAHTRELAKAAEIGTNTHAVIEHELRKKLGQRPLGKAPALMPGAASCYAAFQRWRDDAELVATSLEQVVWSTSIGYAGSYDFIGSVNLNGKRIAVVGDFKTGKAIYQEALAQVSAYCAAVGEMGLVPRSTPLYGLVVRLPKAGGDPDAEFRFISPDEQVGHLEAFKAALALWHWSNP